MNQKIKDLGNDVHSPPEEGDDALNVNLISSQIGLLTIPQFCSRYKIGRSKTYEIIASGELPAKSIGGSMTRIRPVDAEKWAENLTPWESGKQSSARRLPSKTT
jgi:excisionase family DNA binding protein